MKNSNFRDTGKKIIPAKYYKLILNSFFILSFLFASNLNASEPAARKKTLIIVEGSSELSNYAMAGGRKIANLLGHFNVDYTLKGSNDYKSGEMNKFDFIFYFGFHPKNSPSQKFTDDLVKYNKQVIWINSGMNEFSSRYPNFKKEFGFTVAEMDSTTGFDLVKSGQKTFTKMLPKTCPILVSDKKKVTVYSTVSASKKAKEYPYIVHSKNLTYIADSPFDMAVLGGDRYIYFADLLHDILGEAHNEIHRAIIRIEDINPLSNPQKLREIADILSDRNVPFLVGVIPYYINPDEKLSINLSDKQEVVDALKYMVSKGATIVMHGSTHQFRGVSGNDFEFWDINTGKAIKDETEESISKKVEYGLQELMKNGLYPLLWETPHYTASQKFYRTIPKYFSSCIETKLDIEDFDYGQYFPYIINKDIYGQRIYPEDIGYVPLDSNMSQENEYIKEIVERAKANLSVRDGFAACFFHPFLDLELLKELVTQIQELGYTYIDLRTEQNWVKTKDRIIASGSQQISIKLDQQYLIEQYYDKNGELESKTFSDHRMNGTITKQITLKPGAFYVAEPGELKEQKRGYWEEIRDYVSELYANIFSPKKSWNEPHIGVFWDAKAFGAAYNDQASMAAVFTSVNINVDTILTGKSFNLAKYNVVLLPYGSTNLLSDDEYAKIVKYVQGGGNIITDGKNNLLEDLGIKLADTKLKVSHIKDKYFPDQAISWRTPELISKIETDQYEEIFCLDEASETPIAFGKKIGQGRVMYFATRFDPHSTYGYSYYPFAMEYIRKYFNIQPMFRRDNLEMYFDPGFRSNTSIETLVKNWVVDGIRIIHVAGWHEYVKYTYDYGRLIELAHQNGILVYAWLEPPQVSQKFWLEHPKWREKNYLGEDVRPSWRYPVAMTDDNCLKAMVEEYKKLLDAHDWDGVNLAEVYFEAGKGLSQPNLFTPMHVSAQNEFRRKYGAELISIFNPSSKYFFETNPQVKHDVIEYRVNQIAEVYSKLLPVMNSYAQKRSGFEVVVTALDNLGSPELREYIGSDMMRLIELRKSNKFTLQIEDPENRWSEDPYRYQKIAQQYKELIGDKFLLDLNILSFRKPEVATPFPTLIQTGTECFHLIRAAALSSRFTTYAESSVNSQDLYYLPYANSAGLTYRDTTNGYIVETPFSVFLKMPDEKKDIKIDGMFVACSRDNHFLVPAGKHYIEVGSKASEAFSSHDLQTRIMSITANVLSVRYDLSTVFFEYESDTRVLASFDREPRTIIVDGTQYLTNIMKGTDCYTIYLPSGKHKVELIAGDKFSNGINLLSLWSSTGIAIFGMLSVSSLLIMYFVLKIVRKKMKVQENVA